MIKIIAKEVGYSRILVLAKGFNKELCKACCISKIQVGENGV